VTEVRIGGKRRDLVEDRFTHSSPHRLARLVITQREILLDLGIREARKARGAEGGVAEERGEFEEREAVLRKDIERVPEQFIGAGAEGIEMPAMPQHLRELGDLHKAFATIGLFQRIQTDGVFLVSRFDDDQFVAQIPLENSFLCSYRPKQECRGVPVEIEVDEPAACRDVLLREMTQERRLSGAGLAEQRHVLCAPVCRNGDVPARRLLVMNSEAEIEVAVLRVESSRGPPFPKTGRAFFEESKHGVSVRGLRARNFSKRENEHSRCAVAVKTCDLAGSGPRESTIPTISLAAERIAPTC